MDDFREPTKDEIIECGKRKSSQFLKMIKWQEDRIRELETALAHTEELLQRERENNAPRTCKTCGVDNGILCKDCTAMRYNWTPKTKKEE